MGERGRSGPSFFDRRVENLTDFFRENLFTDK